MGLYARRRLTNWLVIGLSVLATAFGLLWLVLVLSTLLVNGIGAIGPSLFTETTPPPGSSGGLLNAIAGSLVMTAIATLVGTPTGILAGTFLAEYSRGSRFGEVVRFVNDILLSAPSINNQFWSSDLNVPMANLPVVIFQFAMSPYADWQVLAWGGALLITAAILALNITARVLAAWSSFKQ